LRPPFSLSLSFSLFFAAFQLQWADILSPSFPSFATELKCAPYCASIQCAIPCQWIHSSGNLQLGSCAQLHEFISKFPLAAGAGVWPSGSGGQPFFLTQWFGKKRSGKQELGGGKGEEEGEAEDTKHSR